MENLEGCSNCDPCPVCGLGPRDWTNEALQVAQAEARRFAELVKQYRDAVSALVGFLETLDYWIQPLPGMSAEYRADMGEWGQIQDNLKRLLNGEGV